MGHPTTECRGFNHWDSASPECSRVPSGRAPDAGGSRAPAGADTGMRVSSGKRWKGLTLVAGDSLLAGL